MPQENNDANQAATSSSAAGTGQTGGQENQQAQVDHAEGGPSNPQLLEVAQRAYDESMARNQTGNQDGQNADGSESSRPQSGQDGQRQDGSTNGQSNQQQVTNQQQGQQDPTKPKLDGQQAQQQAEQVPFHNHPRWQEMLQQRDGLEQRATVAEQRLQQLKPVEEQFNFHRSYMERYGITDQDVANAMQFLALQKTDPQKAIEMLKPIQESLREYDPSVLPKDIQDLVDNNEMTPTAAKMLAQSRAETNAMRRQMDAQKASQQVATSQATNNSIKSWDTLKRGQDPDFKPKQKGQPDGLWELTAKNFAYIQTTRFANNPAEAIANLEEAYKDAKDMVNRLATVRTQVRNPVTSSQSSSAITTKKAPKTVYDVTKEVAAKYGMNYTPPSEQDNED